MGADVHHDTAGLEHRPAEHQLPLGRPGRQDDNGRLASNVGVSKPTPWGGSYTVGWDSTRSTTTNVFSNFSPQLGSSVAFSVRQPLLRNFSIDSLRQQVLTSEKNREISDVEVQQTVATTSRLVRYAYWDLRYANASLGVQQQSLDLARESLRETNSRIQIGSTAPIDAVEAQAEVALREEAVIVAQAQIETAQDTLRALVFNQSSPDFWTTRIEPIDQPAFEPVTVDVDAVVRGPSRCVPTCRKPGARSKPPTSTSATSRTSSSPT